MKTKQSNERKKRKERKFTKEIAIKITISEKQK